MSLHHGRDATACVDELSRALPYRTHEAGSAGLRASLDRVFFPAASRRAPLCVVQPSSAEEVSIALRIIAAHGCEATVRGGGLSSNCVTDGAVMIDLGQYLGSARPDGDHVLVEGGATVGTMLDALAPAGRVVPVGIVGLAGFGLVTRGGVGYLTRSRGLALDHLLEVELVLPSGDIVRLSDASEGDEADLWWAVRGCAPCFGVVTSAVLRTHELGPVWVDRIVCGVDALATYFRVAPELPRDTSMGAVLGYVPGAPDEPVLFVYTACAASDDAAVDRARQAADAVASASADGTRWRTEQRGTYLSGLPEFSIPGPQDAEPAPIGRPAPGQARGSFYGKSVFTGPTLGAAVADALVDQIRSAPTPACRIDFQHTGGALADVRDGDTAFWGRGGEWNIPLNAIWSADDDDDVCQGWARDTVAALKADTIGVYSVEVRPGFAETDAEVEAAYGGNLERLRTLRAAHDRAGTFRTSPL